MQFTMHSMHHGKWINKSGGERKNLACVDVQIKTNHNVLNVRRRRTVSMADWNEESHHGLSMSIPATFKLQASIEYSILYALIVTLLYGVRNEEETWIYGYGRYRKNSISAKC